MGEDFTFTRYTAGWDDTGEIMQDTCYVIDRTGGILEPDGEQLEGTDFHKGRVIYRETYRKLLPSALVIEVVEYRDGRVGWKLLRQPRFLTDNQLLIMDTIADTFGLSPSPFGYDCPASGTRGVRK